MSCSKKGSGGGFKTLLFGILVGLVIGIMYAPKPGGQTLSEVSDRMTRNMPA